MILDINYCKKNLSAQARYFSHSPLPQFYCFFCALHDNKFMCKECDSHGEVRIETVPVELFLKFELKKATYIVQDLCYEQSLGVLI